MKTTHMVQIRNDGNGYGVVVYIADPLRESALPGIFEWVERTPYIRVRNINFNANLQFALEESLPRG